ncbi:MAG TPA: carboxypeptidase-like regulatory domain-containing protein [Pirellulales bacterium]|nr:carboxypeptidase-like regulatory domain-containing protein [Pirellulales bacterium]
MDGEHRIESRLPAPRGDEPPALRQDIADELNDHLQQALARARRRGTDEQMARKAVLDRFGDPASVARRLWFDSMKETIMKERMTMVAMLAVITASVMACVGMWLLLEQSRQANAAVLAELKSLHAAAAQPPVSYDWASATVACVFEGDDARPAPGMVVKLTGRAINPADEITLTETTGDDGTVRFKPIRPGRYRMAIVSPGKWGSSRNTEIIILPGNDYSERIVCPSTVLQETNVTVRLKWPEGEKLEPSVRLECLLYPSNGGRWIEIDGAWWSAPSPPQVALPIGETGEFSMPQTPGGYEPYGDYPSAPVPSPGPYAGAVASWPNLVSPHEAKCAVAAVGYVRAWKLFGPAVVQNSPYAAAVSSQSFAMVEEPQQGDEAPVLQAHPGQDNVWTIEVSKEFVEQINAEAKRLATPSPYASQ